MRNVRIEANPDVVVGDKIRILHLTDPHLFAASDGELRGTATAASLARVLEHYQDSGWRAERTIITGDLIQDDSEAAYERFRDSLLPLNMRMHCLPGNHDVRALMRRICRQPPFSYCATEEIGNWLIVALDSCVSGVAGGRVGEAETQRLAGAVADSSADHVMVCLHHPPVPMGSAWLDTVGLDNGEEFLRRTERLERVRLVVFGHVHQAFDEQRDGIRIIATPSTCSQFLPGSDEFAVDERPPAYRRLTLHANGSCETEVIWVDDE
ncbi:MAG: metallophosphoesterase [Gammaproteobacteria bacterium]|nr:metallophosphoesterase [Gammaproteobacteria bacterium]